MSQRFTIEKLGNPSVESPISKLDGSHFTSESERIVIDPREAEFRRCLAAGQFPESFEVAGPRNPIYFDPAKVRAAVVTCGGLCPGLNAVIRSLVLHLWHRYGVREILGVRYGYQGLSPGSLEKPIPLGPEVVEDIHQRGGSILGSSRGAPTPSQMLDTLQAMGINVLFTIGGDGTMKGALAIHREIVRRKSDVAIVGIPKTIDNDIPFVRRSFGFETAVDIACEAVHAAHAEAIGVRNGVGLVKLMGRESGYIAANSALATGHANFCLVPEVAFKVEGTNGLYELLKARLARRGHALIVVAEGAGQHYFSGSERPRDASGNVKLGDIGVFLKERLQTLFKDAGNPVSVKYIDPSYIIRAAPANPADQMFCTKMAQYAVHAAMAGKTGLLIGYWHGRMTHVPMQALGQDKQRINPDGELWQNVIETTGQPRVIG
jgi:6-phosphofructokinase 1